MNRLRGGRRSLAAVAAAAALWLALGASAANATQPEVGIVSLDCGGTPEVVAIQNAGAETRDLAGWRLVSDPPASEALDLSAAGALSPGETVYIQSGTGASGAFVWSLQPVFRDGDPADFARLLDSTGNTVQEVACAAPATPAPAIPDGGGPPSAPGSARMPALTAGLGGLLMTLGALAVFVPALGVAALRPAAAPLPAPVTGPDVPSLIGGLPFPPRRRRTSGPGDVYLLAAAAGLTAAAAVALAVGSRRRHR